jgi:xanthine/uracil permease
MWMVVVVPPSFGFWLVAGDLAGVPPGEQRTLLLASLFGLGLATLVQALAGHRLPVFEGPASTYLAAIAVLSVSAAGARPEAVTGGLLAAGAFGLLLAAARADRLLRRLFTPPVVATFLVVIVLAVAPATLARAIGRTDVHPWGLTTAWVSAGVVLGGWAGVRAVGALRSYALLGALLLGTLTYFVLGGLPHARLDSGFAMPRIFPWGTPEFSAPIVAPFLIAGILAAFNTIASMQVMGESIERPPDERSQRRGLFVHGGCQLVTSCFGNLLGNVPRLDSVGVVRMIGSDRRQALAVAAVGIIALAFAGPVVDVLALLPVAVSASLLALVLGMLGAEGLQLIGRLHWTRRWLVFAPAVAPTIAWLFVAGQLSEVVQLVANPLLIGIVLAVVLDRAVPAELNPPLALRRARAFRRPNGTGGP